MLIQVNQMDFFRIDDDEDWEDDDFDEDFEDDEEEEGES